MTGSATIIASVSRSRRSCSSSFQAMTPSGAAHAASRAALRVVVAHHRDERVLDGGARLAYALRSRCPRGRAPRATSASGSAPSARRDAQHVPVVRDLVDLGRARAAASAASVGVDRPRARPRASARRCDDLLRRADVEQLAAEDERRAGGSARLRPCSAS